MPGRLTHFAIAALALGGCVAPALAADDAPGNANPCAGLPGYSQLKTALSSAVDAEGSGLNMNMWATVVNRDGVVCAVAFSGTDRGSQWPGSRVISAQKANTANAFSLDASAHSGVNGGALALSTANLFSAVQPGGSLFGLQESNPVATDVAYKGPSSNYGAANDPMVGRKIGGINVFGGGLALYAAGSRIVGAVGVSGDTSCSDHNIAWRVRHNLNLDHLLGTIPGPASLFAGDANHPDNIIFDITPNASGGTGVSATGFGHPTCLNNPPSAAAAAGKPPVAAGLPAVQ
ncbi:MAG: heme-binding protein [Acidobacteriia bacterium]|nr:heme-binding protein [Terriglobia bacterium]